MLTSIKGIYNNGQIILTEEPPFTAPAAVIVTFLRPNNAKPIRKPGGMEGKVMLPENFNEPLVRTDGRITQPYKQTP